MTVRTLAQLIVLGTVNEGVILSELWGENVTAVCLSVCVRVQVMMTGRASYGRAKGLICINVAVSQYFCKCL